jgi:hypothetical protein
MVCSLRFLTSTGRRAPASEPLADAGPKGREASALAVPPFLHAAWLLQRPASLGCCCRGNHPPEPTCRVGRRSSASRSGARSRRFHVFRASTIPESLSRSLPVLLPVVTGDRCRHNGLATIDVKLSDCARQSADRSAEWRPSARRTGPTHWPPKRRAGGSLPLVRGGHWHHMTPRPCGQASAVALD